MSRALALAVLVGIAFALVAVPRRARPCPELEPDEIDDTDTAGDYGPLPDGFRIGRVGRFIH